MDDRLIPSDLWSIEPWYLNILENTATVQFNHRVLGSTTAISALGLLAAGGLSTKAGSVVTPQVRRGLYALGVAATGQATLGVVTLLQYVPISLAAAHQLGSVAVFTCGLYLVHSLRYARPLVIRVARQQMNGESKVVA